MTDYQDHIEDSNVMRAHLSRVGTLSEGRVGAAGT
jgi:hypothetical protein